MIEKLWPTKKQYQRWSLPSKLTFIGTYIGLISLVFSLLIFIQSQSAKKAADHGIIVKTWDETRAKAITLDLLKNYGGLKEYDLVCPSLGPHPKTGENSHRAVHNLALAN